MTTRFGMTLASEEYDPLHWPPAPVRLKQLEEAVEVVRQMWTGESIDHEGTYYCVEDARLYDPPEQAIPVVVSAFGPAAAEVAARIGDGLWTSGKAKDTVERWSVQGGTGPVYSQLTYCWGADRDKAIEQAHRIWRNVGVPGQLSQDLPTPTHFEQATSLVTPEMVAASIPCGPDAGAIIERAKTLIEAGVDHVYFHQIGADQEGFCEVWRNEIGPALRVA